MSLIGTLITKLESQAVLSDSDRSLLLALPVHSKTLKPTEHVATQGSKPSHSVVVIAGVLARHQEFPDGERQCVSYHFQGEMPDLHSVFVHRMDHTLDAITQSTIGAIRHADIRAAIAKSSTLGEILWRETLIDAAIFRQWIANNGKRGALGGTAHLFCELIVRAKAIGLCNNDGTWHFPLTQQHIADAVGISIVHTNRILRSLRQSEAMVIEHSCLRVLDWARLTKIAGFNPGYLHLRQDENSEEAARVFGQAP